MSEFELCLNELEAAEWDSDAATKARLTLMSLYSTTKAIAENSQHGQKGQPNLRDQFAMAALIADKYEGGTDFRKSRLEIAAKRAYELADAMIIVRDL